MTEIDVIYYVAKYTKGNSGYLIQRSEIESSKLPILQKIFKIDPNHPNILDRKMFGNYDINKKQAALLQPLVGLTIDLDKYNYQLEGGGEFIDNNTDNPLIDSWYFVNEFEKSIPWRFVEECKLDITLDFLRKIFQYDKYHSEPTDYGFEPKINLDPKYAESLQPYVTFKFELDNYDYWIEKRAEGEKREDFQIY